MELYPDISAPLYVEEFIEGTMINAFFNTSCGVSGCWQIATRNTVGAEVSYFKWESKQTFNNMFSNGNIKLEGKNSIIMRRSKGDL